MPKPKRKTASNSKTLSLAANSSTLKVKFETQSVIEKPTSYSTMVTRARYYSDEIEWLQNFLPLKLSVYNYGLEFTTSPDDKGKAPTDADSKKLLEWLDTKNSIQFEPYVDPTTSITIEPEEISTNRELLETFVEDCWREFILLDVLVVLWLDNNGYASILPPESCEYRDVLGVPILKFQHGLGVLDIPLLPKDQQELFKLYPAILINPANGQHFKVLKRSRIGTGFTKPRIQAIFRLLGEIESKQIALNTLAFAMRKVTRWHKIGHKIDSGDRAGKPMHFYKTTRATEIKKLWVDVVGIDDYVSNFDEEIEWPWPPKELFSDDYFDSSLRRLEDWGGPLAVMMRATAQMPYLMPLLKALAMQDRFKMARFLTQTINAAFEPPVPLRVSWSNLIFNEARLAMELMKFGVISGLVSNTTAATEIGVDPEKEVAQKLVEANAPDHIKKYTPIWDASHGINPEIDVAMKKEAATAKAKSAVGQAPGAQPGKPPGTVSNT